MAYIAGYFERYILRGAESSGIALCFPLHLLSPLSRPSDCSCLAVVTSPVDSPVIVVIVLVVQWRPSSLPETGIQRGKNHEKIMSLNREPHAKTHCLNFCRLFVHHPNTKKPSGAIPPPFASSTSASMLMSMSPCLICENRERLHRELPRRRGHRGRGLQGVLLREASEVDPDGVPEPAGWPRDLPQEEHCQVGW